MIMTTNQIKQRKQIINSGQTLKLSPKSKGDAKHRSSLRVQVDVSKDGSKRISNLTVQNDNERDSLTLSKMQSHDPRYVKSRDSDSTPVPRKSLTQGPLLLTNVDEEEEDPGIKKRLTRLFFPVKKAKLEQRTKSDRSLLTDKSKATSMQVDPSADVMYQQAAGDSISIIADKSPFPLESVLDQAESELGIDEEIERSKEEAVSSKHGSFKKLPTGFQSMQTSTFDDKESVVQDETSDSTEMDQNWDESKIRRKNQDLNDQLKKKFIIHPNNRGKQFWDSIATVALIATCFITPLQLALFSHHKE